MMCGPNGGRWLCLALLAALLAACSSRPRSWEELNAAAGEALAAGRSIEAETHLLAALDVARNEEVGSTLVPLSLHRLARFYDARQRYAQAAEYYSLALEADSKRFPMDDPALWETVERFAGTYENMQQFAEAREVYSRFLKMQEAALGPDALAISATVLQIGRLLRLRGGYEEAQDNFQRALKIRIEHLGQDNDELPEILDEYIALLRDMEKPYEADLMEERAAQLRMRGTARRMEQAR